MATTYRFYGCAIIGDGASPATAIRPKIANYIDGSNGTFWNWINDIAAFQLCLAKCDSTLHTTIAADADIAALSPQFADIPAINAWLDQPVGTISTAIINKLENNGFPMDWLDPTIANRQLWRRLSRHMVIGQVLHGVGDNAINFLKQNLNTQVSAVPSAVRNRAQNWMTENGMDTSWITGSTTVRQVINYVCSFNGPEMALGIDL